MKRLISLLMATVMVLTVFVGCGNTDENENASSNLNSSKVEKTVLTFMAVGGSNEQAFTDVIIAAADKFNAKNEFNAEIDLEWYENEQYKTKLATLMTQNDVTDIFFTWEAGFMKDYVESGKVYPLSDALASDKEWAERFNGGVFDAVTFDEKIYGVPMGQAIIPVYYSKSAFANNGVGVPTTWDELMAAIKTFKDAGIVPMAMASQDAWVSGQMMLELSGGVAGKSLFTDIVSGKTTWDDPRYIETGKVFQELVNAGAFPEGFLGIRYDEGRNLFLTGKAAMYPMGTWDTSAVLSGVADANDVGVFLLPPKDPSNKDVHISSIEKIFAISESCENKEAAIAFLKTLSDPEIQEQYVVNCGAIPATNVKIEESKIDACTREIMTWLSALNPLTPMDRQFGASVGGEFNNISLAIAAGKSPEDQFKALQKYAELEAGQ